MIPIFDLGLLLRNMEPAHNSGQYVFASLESSATLEMKDVVAFVREPEGLSVILEESVARRYGIVAESTFAWITLTVHSDLQAVGLTAAVASALSRAGISCNVVAGTNHDHIFVPGERAAAAMTALQALQRAHS